MLAAQLAAFSQSHPDLQLEWAVKSTAGTGGTLSYLRTGHDVAPSILPDLVLLPSEQLGVATTEQLIYPLNNLLPADYVGDLYPAARTMAFAGDNLMGYPYALANLQHMAYNSEVISDTVPASWEGLITHPTATFIFPAAGTEGAELALQFYLAAGGALTDAANQPYLDVAALTVALNALSQGRASGLVLLQSSNVATMDEAWQLFQGGAASMVQVRAGQYLVQRGPGGGFGPLPGPGGPLAPMVRGWSWAISTADPARQALAAELLMWLAAERNLGDWSWQSKALPARRGAYGQWPVGDDYITFLQRQSEAAIPYPVAPGNPLLVTLGAAVFDVVSLAQSPQVAAEEAAAALRP
jgi:ABC-type glycerol-3-phosphate transport system substrate-binding protein